MHYPARKQRPVSDLPPDQRPKLITDPTKYFSLFASTMTKIPTINAVLNKIIIKKKNAKCSLKYVPTNCKDSNALRSQKSFFQEINQENPKYALIVKNRAFIYFSFI